MTLDLSMFYPNRGRRRGQRPSPTNPRKKGPSWMVRWREDVRAADGTIERREYAKVRAPCTGPGKITKRQADSLAWELIFSKLDAVVTQKGLGHASREMDAPDPDPTPENAELPSLGERLKKARYTKGHNQDVAAAKIGMSPTGLRKIEKGRVRPQATTAKAINDYIGDTAKS